MSKMSWWVRLILRIGAWKSDDPEAKKLELGGFDFMDKSSVKPIQVMVERLQASKPTTSC